eukprot:TRINITY_DN6253_c0_g1_i1.p2 TRINITY_DN6253_c0_g1~~TRINITY_DN6253_c0_g1_i1.p2  ORF type:complete len:55 (-),score=29.69 TRINITY_DN6253_c0_g1_i1:16-180(-)
MKLKKKPANYNPASIHPNWTGDVLFTNKELKRLETHVLCVDTGRSSETAKAHRG